MNDEYNWRREKGEILKSRFNELLDEAQEISNGDISYKSICRIADIMRFDARPILDGKSLPQIIDVSLELAIGIFDPNNISRRETMKKALSLAGGAGGIGIIATCLYPILFPSIWTRIAVFFSGGIAGGLRGPLGIIGGGVLFLASVYKGFQKLTPNERIAKCHKLVMDAINEWINEGRKAITK